MPAWRLAEDPAAIVIKILARVALSGPRPVPAARILPNAGRSQLKVFERGGQLVETRYADHRGHSLSFFPADPAIGEYAAWLIVRPGFDGMPALDPVGPVPLV